jgi:integrase
LARQTAGLAEARAREYWAAITAAPTERVRDLWPAYVRDRLKEVKNTKRFRATLDGMEPHFGHRLGTVDTADDCRAYYEASKAAGKSDSTIKNGPGAAAGLPQQHLGDRAPNIWLPPSSKPRSAWLTPEDVAKVYADARSPHVALFIELAIATGARMSAILELTWDRVDLENGFRRPDARRQPCDEQAAGGRAADGGRSPLEEAKEGRCRIM